MAAMEIRDEETSTKMNNHNHNMNNKNGRTTSYGSSSSSVGANAISPNDVLCGRGGLTNQHVGNKRFRYIVAEFQQEYLNAKKKEKKEIARRIVARVHSNGGRFLKRTIDSSVWSEVTYKKALEKTSQACREGLDVRHKTVRPEKMIHRLESDSSHEDNPRKRARLVEGLVMESPKMVSRIPRGGGEKGGLPDDIPDLQDEREEQALHLSPRFDSLFQDFLPPLPQSSSFARSEFKNVEQI